LNHIPSALASDVNSSIQKQCELPELWWLHLSALEVPFFGNSEEFKNSDTQAPSFTKKSEFLGEDAPSLQPAKLPM
jgi:hypothetical protein